MAKRQRPTKGEKAGPPLPPERDVYSLFGIRPGALAQGLAERAAQLDEDMEPAEEAHLRPAIKYRTGRSSFRPPRQGR